jgi:hypothetical protein
MRLVIISSHSTQLHTASTVYPAPDRQGLGHWQSPGAGPGGRAARRLGGGGGEEDSEGSGGQVSIQKRSGSMSEPPVGGKGPRGLALVTVSRHNHGHWHCQCRTGTALAVWITTGKGLFLPWTRPKHDPGLLLHMILNV